MIKGLTIVYTGNGKGKTTASLGLALRAAGHDLKVLILQFVKSQDLQYGEHKALKKLEDYIQIETFGKGFIGILGDKKSHEEHLEGSQQAFNRLLQAIKSENYRMIICDEIFGAIHANHLKIEDLIKVVKTKPSDLHLVFTGRSAPQEITDLADLVSEIKELKHPYASGIMAQKGIEF